MLRNLGLMLAFVLFAVAGVASAAPLPVEEYGTLPRMSGVSISPSGRYIATIQAVDDQTVLAVYDTTTSARLATIPSGKAKIRQTRWYSDDRLMMVVGQLKEVTIPGRDIIYEACRILVMNRDGSQPISLGCAGSSILSLKGPEPDTILMAGYNFTSSEGSGQRTGPRESTNVYQVNIRTGAVKELEKGNKFTAGFIADAKGQVRIRISGAGGSAVYATRRSPTDSWYDVAKNKILEFEEEGNANSQSMQFFGFGDNPNEVYVSYRDGDKTVLGVFDLNAERVTRAVLKDPRWDASDFISDRYGRVVGGTINRWSVEQEYFVPEWQALQREVKENFPGHKVLIGSVSDDLKKVIAYVEGPQAPGGAYQYIDFQKGDGFNVGFKYPAITAAQAGTVREVVYKARDGREIDAYLTIPAGTSGRNMPAIVMPHGGPQARDSGMFDWWSQFLASRGYAILQPQYRGSDGYGRAFAEAGRYQWGLKMQDDVTDGVRYMIDQGVFDPKRVCILGWSYGGYAAMAGAAFTPELYRCSVAGAGVSDLVMMLREEMVGSSGSNFAYRYWKKHIGDVGKDIDRIRKTSPALSADRVSAPMLLVHGRLDTVVPISQSEIMADALKRAGKPHEFVVLDGEDHNLSFSKSRIAALRAMEQFLLKHNPPR